MNDAIDRVQALPIFLLVAASLTAGSGLWCFLRSSINVALGLSLLVTALLLFIAAGISMRQRKLIMRDSNNDPT